MKFLIKLLLSAHIFIYRLTKGTIGGRIWLPLLLLNSTGRKTGRKRTTPVGYIRDGDCYVITASNGGAARHPAWFYNLQSNPQTTIEVMGETLAMVAQVATPEEKKRLWAELIKTAPGFEQYQKRTTREIPMIILCPVEKGA